MTKASIVKAIQEVADATGDNNYRISLGATGNNLENSVGEKKPTGASWAPEPKSFSIIMEGIARYFGTARQMTTSGNLSEEDHRIELADNGVTVSLPAPEDKYIGQYVVKALGTTGGGVSGTIDGSPATLPVVNWEFLTLYCSGTAWLTG